MSKALKFGLAFGALLAIAGGVALYSAFQAAQRVPDFYRQAVAADPTTQHAPRDEFIAETTALASDLHREGRWQHEFTAEQINAWLALELATNYPELLAAGWSEPRVSIEEHQATIACRYQHGSLSTVLSLTLDAYLHEPNVLALRIRGARAGTLRVPLAQVLDAISHAARELKLRLEWRKDDGDPVALVTFPQPRDSQAPAVRLETVELRHGKLVVAGAMARGGDNLVEANPLQGLPRREPAQEQPLVGAAEKDTRHN
jgi:hypothetical protein